MFSKGNDERYSTPMEGIERKTLVYGQRTLMTEFRLKKKSVLPMHAHPYEQTGYLVSGKLKLKIGDQTYDAEAGDSWCIPFNVEHGADIREDAVAIEIFSPVRDDYLPEEQK